MHAHMYTFILNLSSFYMFKKIIIIHSRFERSLRNTPNLNDLTSFKPLSFWLEALLASLECYHWAFSDSLKLQTVLDGMFFYFTQFQIYNVLIIRSN